VSSPIPIHNRNRHKQRTYLYWKRRKQQRHAILSSIITLGYDNRPHAEIQIDGQKLVGLLDSGSSISVLGRNCMSTIKGLGLALKPISRSIRTADGSSNSMVGFVDANVVYENQSRLIRFYLVPTLQHNLYLGIDFWRSFNVAPNIVSCCDLSTMELPETARFPYHHLSAEQQAEVDAVKKLFLSYETNGLGRTSVIEHKIDVGDAAPIKQRHYSVSPVILNQIYEIVDRMIQLDVIEESTSSWSSPVILVKKANGQNRLCLDPRKVNNVTIKDAYPLPLIDGLLGRLHETKFITSIDLKDAFWQIPLAPDSRDKTTFSVPGRPLYQFKVMPFGLCNAPQTMCRLMDKVIPHRLHDRIFVYLDDLLIISATYEEHIKLLSEVAELLRKANLTINVQKSKFLMREIRYLGYIVGEHGLSPDPHKVAAIKEFPTPTSVKQIRRLLGMAGWYRRFIPNFATVTEPLTNLTRKNSRFTWNESAQQAFNTLRNLLTSAPVLRNPDYTQPFIIRCDASSVGIGGVLMQKSRDGHEHPIAYMSQKLNTAQRNYTVTELECLAAVVSIKKFRPYIEGYDFTVITDHASLQWLMANKDLKSRLIRWSLQLQGYRFTIQHVRGSENVVADALSRVNCDSIAELSTDAQTLSRQLNLEDPAFDNETYVTFRDAISQNPNDYPNLRVLNNRIYIRLDPRPRESLTDLPAWKLWLPEQLRSQILRTEHDAPTASHGGVSKTLERIRRFYYWPRMRKEISDHVGA
jgi:hypothetical protein